MPSAIIITLVSQLSDDARPNKSTRQMVLIRCPGYLSILVALPCQHRAPVGPDTIQHAPLPRQTLVHGEAWLLGQRPEQGAFPSLAKKNCGAFHTNSVRDCHRSLTPDVLTNMLHNDVWMHIHPLLMTG